MIGNARSGGDRNGRTEVSIWKRPDASTLAKASKFRNMTPPGVMLTNVEATIRYRAKS
jgi:hypothetical protein